MAAMVAMACAIETLSSQNLNASFGIRSKLTRSVRDLCLGTTAQTTKLTFIELGRGRPKCEVTDLYYIQICCSKLRLCAQRLGTM